MNKQRRVGETIAIQSWLRPALTPVMANKDFAIFREQLNKVGGLLEGSLLEEMAMDFGVIGFEAESARCQSRRMELALKALRVEALRMLLRTGAAGPDVNETGETQTSGLTVTIRWIPRNERRLTMSGWSARFPKQARPMPAKPETAHPSRHRNTPCMSNHGPVFKIPGFGTGSS